MKKNTPRRSLPPRPSSLPWHKPKRSVPARPIHEIVADVRRCVQRVSQFIRKTLISVFHERQPYQFAQPWNTTLLLSLTTHAIPPIIPMGSSTLVLLYTSTYMYRKYLTPHISSIYPDHAGVVDRFFFLLLNPQQKSSRAYSHNSTRTYVTGHHSYDTFVLTGSLPS